MPTDAEKQAEKDKDAYLKSYKFANRLDRLNPDKVAPTPLDDLIKQKEEEMRLQKETLAKLKEPNAYKPTPIAASWLSRHTGIRQMAHWRTVTYRLLGETETRV